jgi:hypothetical protein
MCRGIELSLEELGHRLELELARRKIEIRAPSMQRLESLMHFQG